MAYSEDPARDARRRARARWPVRVYRLGDEPPDDLSNFTPDQRVALAYAATLRAWKVSGRPMPRGRRSKWPGRITRRR